MQRFILQIKMYTLKKVFYFLYVYTELLYITTEIKLLKQYFTAEIVYPTLNNINVYSYMYLSNVVMLNGIYK